MTTERGKTREILVGTCGWVYPHWRGTFYPAGLPQREWLRYYSQHFRGVEVNYSFYRLPGESTLRSWVQAVPPRFVFAVKGSRYITHRLRLQNAAGAVRNFLQRVQLLGSRLGPVLWQLAPSFPYERDVFARFLEALPQGFVHVFEFRHFSWLEDEVLGLLNEHSCSLCVHDWGDGRWPRTVVGDIGYVRLHGGLGDSWGKYSRSELSDWADWIAAEMRGGARRFFIYFNNDARGNAVRDAQMLLQLLREAGAPGLA